MNHLSYYQVSRLFPLSALQVMLKWTSLRPSLITVLVYIFRDEMMGSRALNIFKVLENTRLSYCWEGSRHFILSPCLHPHHHWYYFLLLLTHYKGEKENLIFFKQLFNFGICLDLQKSCKDNTDDSYIPHAASLNVNNSCNQGAFVTTKTTSLLGLLAKIKCYNQDNNVATLLLTKTPSLFRFHWFFH